jgi:alkanesulfonate monooxygenase SsuD/methylene tetrahydromethanopterin reductase-like flavin-dependent oxidoreductase (luciferase family)
VTVHVGLTLPSFVDDPAIPLAVARAAEAAELDGVFVFDHVFRGAASSPRPALEGIALLGAVAAATSRISVGTLVARVTLRPPAVLAAALATAARIAPGRVIAGVGAGDHESRAENEEYGLGFGDLDFRVDALRAAVSAVRAAGVPTWVGGTHRRVREVAASSDGWNRWGGPPGVFARQAADVRAAAGERPFTVSWGGLVLTAADDAALAGKRARHRPGGHVLAGPPERLAEQLAPYTGAGAAWLVLGPLDSSDPRNADLLAEVRSLLRA